MARQAIKIIFGIASTIGIIYTMDKLLNPSKLNVYNIEQEEIIGNVVYKYIDKPESKRVAYVQIINAGNYYTYFIPTDSIYESLNLGDLIIKKRNSMKYLIVRDNDTLTFNVHVYDGPKMIK